MVSPPSLVWSTCPTTIVNLVTQPWAAIKPPRLCRHSESTHFGGLSPHPSRNPHWAHSRVGLKVAIAYCFDQLLCDFNDFLLPYCWFNEKNKRRKQNKSAGAAISVR